MRKNLVTIVIISLFLVLAGADVIQAATLTLGNSSGALGTEDVIVPVNIASGAGENVAGINLDINYSATQLSFNGVSAGQAAIDADKSVSSSTPAEGVIRIVVFGVNQNSMNDGVMANVNFDIPAGASVGEVVLSVSNAVATDPDANEVTLSTVNGSVMITGVSNLDEIKVYPNPCRKGQEVKINNLPLNSDVKIYIYDIAGELIRVLREGEEIEAGTGSGTGIWDCKNEVGENVASGIYIYLIKSNKGNKKGKIALIR